MSKRHTLKCKCGARYQVAVDLAGKKARCNQCGLKFVIPGPREKKVSPGDRMAPSRIPPGSANRYLLDPHNPPPPAEPKVTRHTRQFVPVPVARGRWEKEKWSAFTVVSTPVWAGN